MRQEVFAISRKQTENAYYGEFDFSEVITAFKSGGRFVGSPFQLNDVSALVVLEFDGEGENVFHSEGNLVGVKTESSVCHE